MSPRQYYLAFVSDGRFGTKQAISLATGRVRRYVPSSALTVPIHFRARISWRRIARPTVVAINRPANDIITCNEIGTVSADAMALSCRRASDSSALRIKRKKKRGEKDKKKTLLLAYSTRISWGLDIPFFFSRTSCMYTDPQPVTRPVNHLSWSTDEQNRLAASYSFAEFKTKPPGVNPCSYIWDIGMGMSLACHRAKTLPR